MLNDLPLREIWSYDPRFKVESCLYSPLWKRYFTEREILLEVLSLCAQLELKCKDGYQRTHSVLSEMEFMNTFKPQASLEFQKMRSQLTFLKGMESMSLKDYMECKKMHLLFPKLWSYLCTPESPKFHRERSIMKKYFERMATLNQLKTISQQIHQDLDQLVNHKYLAHQTALLYKAVTELGSPLSQYKQEIEKLFGEVKAILKAHCGQIPHLVGPEKKRLEQVTRALITIATELNEQLTAPLNPVLNYLEG